METAKIVKEAKIIMMIGLIIGVILLGAGIIFSILQMNLFPNNRAIIGLSFIPLSVAFIYYLKLLWIKKYPQTIKEIIINESDERLVALKNEADAKAFKILQATIFLVYTGYTLMVPADIFESVGWWILLIILFVSFIAQAIFGVRQRG